MMQKAQTRAQSTGKLLTGLVVSTALTCAAFLLPLRSAWAQSDLSPIKDSDWGSIWIDHLLRGTPLPESLSHGFGHLDALAHGLRQALEAYSLVMLGIAVLLLFYHLVAIVVETAHSGHVFGGRMNGVWAPVRLVLAIGLLVPVSGGLNSGQYLVIKIADEGSALASHAWHDVLDVTQTGFATLVAPHAPPLGGLVTVATEMEMCRVIYEQLYAPQQNDATLRLAGHVNDIIKIPANRLSGEIWRYSNTLNSAAPLCGEYRFPGYRPHTAFNAANNDDAARIAASLSSFAEEQAGALATAAKGLALRESANLTGGSFFTMEEDMRNNLTALETSLSANYAEKIRTTFALGTGLNGPALAQSGEGGWIAAAFFIPEIVRLQQSYGELAAGALPEAQEPALAHPLVMQQLLGDTFRAQPLFDAAEAGKLAQFYTHTGNIVASLHGWLYGNHLVDGDFTPSDSFDLRDQINAATSPRAVFDIFAHALDGEAVALGVWGVANGDSGYPFTSLYGTASYSPLAMLSEFGRRQYQLGLDLIGLAGQEIFTPNAAAPAAFAGLGGACFIIGACLLIFALPFWVFLRFGIAVVAWMLLVFEAVAAVPLVALAHLTPTGEGLSGSLARQAYLLWLGLFVRPVLTVAGLVAGMILFTFALSFLALALTPFAQMSSTGNSGLLITGNVAVVLTFDLMAYALANISFKGISLFPDQALRWLSGFVMTDSNPSSVATVPVTPSGGGPHLSIFSGVTNYLSAHNGASKDTSAQNYREKIKPYAPGKQSAEPQPKNLQKALFPTPSEGPAKKIKTPETEANPTASSSKSAGEISPDKDRTGTAPHKNDAFFTDKKPDKD